MILIIFLLIAYLIKTSYSLVQFYLSMLACFQSSIKHSFIQKWLYVILVLGNAKKNKTRFLVEWENINEKMLLFY